jgi:hypothetical protein
VEEKQIQGATVMFYKPFPARMAGNGDKAPLPPAEKVCACGCGESIAHLAPQARYLSDSHRKAFDREEEAIVASRPGQWRPAAELELESARRAWEDQQPPVAIASGNPADQMLTSPLLDPWHQHRLRKPRGDEGLDHDPALLREMTTDGHGQTLGCEKTKARRESYEDLHRAARREVEGRPPEEGRAYTRWRSSDHPTRETRPRLIKREVQPNRVYWMPCEDCGERHDRRLPCPESVVDLAAFRPLPRPIGFALAEEAA